MKRALTLVMALAVAGALIAAPRNGSAQTGPAWTTFGGNPQRSGSTTAAGPTTSATTNQWQLPQGVHSSPVVDANGIAYVGDDDGNVYALNPFMTKPEWTYTTGGKVISTPSLSPDGKTLYVGSDDGNVYALSTATGQRLWGVSLGSPVDGSPLVTYDGATVIVSSVDGTIAGIKAADGTPSWHFAAGSSVTGSLSLSPDGSTFFVATTNSYVFGIQATGSGAGQNVVSTSYLDSAATSTPSVDGNDDLYVATARGNLESFNPDGSLRWTYALPSGVKATSTPAISNGLVVFGATNGTLYDLSASTGQPVWSSFPHAGGNIGSSAAISSNGLIYVGSDDFNVYAIKAQDGTTVWTKNTGGAESASPAIGPDGSLWVASQSGNVYRISATQANPTPTITPTATATHTPGPTATPTLPNLPPPPPPPGQATATATPSATSTPSPTATPVPPTFTLTRVRVQARVKADWNSRSNGQKRVRARTAIVLAIYVRVTQIPVAERLTASWQVTRGGHVVAHHGQHIDLAAGATGRHFFHWKHTFTSAGRYKYTGTATIAGSTARKSATFTVVK